MEAEAEAEAMLFEMVEAEAEVEAVNSQICLLEAEAEAVQKSTASASLVSPLLKVAKVSDVKRYPLPINVFRMY